MTPRVSIIITTRNRAKHLRDTLNSFQGLHIPKELPTELLVVDNASSDDTAEVIKTTRLSQMPLRYLYEQQPGQSNARNTGMANTSGEVILFTDDDVRVPANWVSSMSEPILRKKAEAVAGGIRLAPHLEREWLTPTFRGRLADTSRLRGKPLREFVGANMCFARMVLQKVSMFDPELGPGRLGFADDTLFFRQLVEAGFRACAQWEVEVEHHFEEARLTRKAWLEHARKLGHSAAYLSYHWYHEPIAIPGFRWGRACCRVIFWRAKKFREAAPEEGIPDWEYDIVWTLANRTQYLAETRRPRNYEKRGLAKIAGVKCDRAGNPQGPGRRELCDSSI